ncbi:MAG TPA: hypothetical protein VII94_00575 [Candidatus Saccharimonadales bacterium]
MHPEIKAFWEAIAPIRSMPIRYDNGISYIFLLEKENPSERICIARQFINGQILYSTGKWDTLYSEEEMLRIIKLKAFF